MHRIATVNKRSQLREEKNVGKRELIADSIRNVGMGLREPIIPPNEFIDEPLSTSIPRIQAASLQRCVPYPVDQIFAAEPLQAK